MEWWADAEFASHAPPLTAACDVALAIVIASEKRKPDGRTEVPKTEIVLVALSLIQALHAWEAPSEVVKRLQAEGTWLNLYSHVVQIPLAVQLLGDDTHARQLAALRPPQGEYVGSERPSQPRPMSEWGTVPDDVDAELATLLNADPAEGWDALRYRAFQRLSAYYGAYGTAMGHVYTHLRRCRVRRAWLDQPDVPPFLGPGEPSSF